MSAYELNRLMYDLREPENRQMFNASLEDYLSRYDVTEEEKDLVRGHDWQGLVDAGVSIYVLTKIGAVLGISLYAMGATMRGADIDAFWSFVREQNARNASYAVLP